MEKIWIYIVILLVGIIIGGIIHWYMVRNRINNTEITVRKIKQKKTTDSVQDVTNIITEETKSRKELREEKKLARQNKRALRKQNK